VRLGPLLLRELGYLDLVVPGAVRVHVIAPAQIIEEQPSARLEQPLREQDGQAIGTPVFRPVEKYEVILRLDCPILVNALLDFSLQKPGVGRESLVQGDAVSETGAGQDFLWCWIPPPPAGGVDAEQVARAVGFERRRHEDGRSASCGPELKQLLRLVAADVPVKHAAPVRRYVRRWYPRDDPRGVAKLHPPMLGVV